MGDEVAGRGQRALLRTLRRLEDLIVLNIALCITGRYEYAQ